MKKIILTDEEKQILKEVEAGEWKSVKNLAKVKKEMQLAAEYTLAKTKNINIRLSAGDLYKLKAKAMEVGIPYQTMVAAVLHKFANKEKGIEISI